MMRLGLIGKSLKHSFSPAYFEAKFKKEGIEGLYQTFELSAIEEFERLAQNEELNGLNVTIPFKEAVIPFLDELDPIATKIGAVNTICFKKGKKIGYNTDAPGFLEDLKSLLKPTDQNALVLGTGGASKAVIYALQSVGIKTEQVSRNARGIKYTDLTEALLGATQLIINTTPVGMYPEVDACVDLPWSGINNKHLLYDLIYNPKETLFLKRGKEKGARTRNGYKMLVNQAELSFELWEKNT
jgi:shikimate dehydrogenase